MEILIIVLLLVSFVFFIKELTSDIKKTFFNNRKTNIANQKPKKVLPPKKTTTPTNNPQNTIEFTQPPPYVPPQTSPIQHLKETPPVDEWIKVAEFGHEWHGEVIYISTREDIAKVYSYEIEHWGYHDDSDWNTEETLISIEEAIKYVYNDKKAVSLILANTKKDYNNFLNQLEKNNSYTYNISGTPESNKWIFIQCNEENSMIEYEPFIELVKNIAKKWNNDEWEGNIFSVGDMRYKVKNDPIDLVYQWDDLFGIVFEYKNSTNLDGVKSFLADNYNIC